MASYGILKEIALPFEIVLKKLPIELRRKSFEIISNVRIDNELHKNIGVEFKRYALIGAWNLPLSYKALMREDMFGLVLSCSIIVFEKEDTTVVGVIRPSTFLPLLDNEYLNEGALTIERKLTEVLDVLAKKKFPRDQKKDPNKPLNFEKTVAFLP